MGSNGQVTVDLENVSVSYPVPGSGSRRSFRKASDRSVHALSGVTVQFRSGECVGILGRNGAGKSTLMRVVSGLTQPTGGTARAVERPVLLTVGSVLVPSASGRENATLGLLAMGLSRRDARIGTGQVLEFAGLGQAADRPLATYSTGMAARLKFAVATHRPGRIVLLDEALSVGDEEFRERCRERIDRIAQDSSTILLVSHSTSSVNRMCTRAVWIESGMVRLDGPVRQVTAQYRKHLDIDATT